MPNKQQTIAARRARYETLKASGQAPPTLPGPSARPAPSIADGLVIRREAVPGGWYWTTPLRTGDVLRLQTGDAPSSVSLIAWRAEDTSERLNTADTVKIQWTSALAKGRVILSDMGRVMLSIVEDSGACHDALLGGATSRSAAERHREGARRNTRDNFLLAAQKLGMGARDVPPCVTFFAPVRVDGGGNFRWHEERRRGGDYVDLRAEMNLLLALSNCQHPLDPVQDLVPSPVEAICFHASPLVSDDVCRSATDEARRAFENTAALVSV